MQRICVYCGANPGKRPEYQALAQRLGTAIAERGWELVYGGADKGTMGVLADAALAARGRVIGIIPEQLVEKEIAHPRLSVLEVVDSMHTRKARMAELADAFVALPGGFGTLDELVEILTWGQLDIHQKPCGVVNINGYFDHFIAHCDHAVAEGFLKPVHRQMLLSAQSADELLGLFASYQAPSESKWIES